MNKNQSALATAHLEGAWRALYSIMGYRDAAIFILRNIDRDHWELIPKGMMEFIVEKFNNDMVDIVPGNDQQPADV